MREATGDDRDPHRRHALRDTRRGSPHGSKTEGDSAGRGARLVAAACGGDEETGQDTTTTAAAASDLSGGTLKLAQTADVDVAFDPTRVPTIRSRGSTTAAACCVR